MSYSNRLTELHYFLKNSNQSLNFINTPEFKSYYFDNLNVFLEVTFTYGFEIRDLEPGSVDIEVLQFLTLVEEGYTKFKEEIDNNNKNKVIFNIGLINIYLYYCQIEDLVLNASIISQHPFFINPTATAPKVNIKIDPERSVKYLRQATKLASETIDIANGIYLFQIIRLFEYIFAVFENYKISNDNLPIDLDSIYIYTDQLESEELWLELIRQMKVKYTL